MEEKELIKRLKNGDEESFRIVVDRFQKQVLNNCYRIVCNRETAEDLTQEVFVEVYRSVNMFRGESALSTWIYRIAVSKSLDYLKSQKRKKRFAVVKSIFDSGMINEHPKTSESETPGKYLDNEERIKVLTSALEKLSENQRIAFTLSKNDEMSNKDIADVLDVSVSSVESLIHRAKTKLRKILYKYYVGQY